MKIRSILFEWSCYFSARHGFSSKYLCMCAMCVFSDTDHRAFDECVLLFVCLCVYACSTCDRVSSSRTHLTFLETTTKKRSCLAYSWLGLMLYRFFCFVHSRFSTIQLMLCLYVCVYECVCVWLWFHSSFHFHFN